MKDEGNTLGAATMYVMSQMKPGGANLEMIIKEVWERGKRAGKDELRNEFARLLDIPYYTTGK